MITTTSSSNGNMSKNLNKDLSNMKKSQFRFLYGFALKKTAGWTAIYSILLTLCYPLIAWKQNYQSAYYPEGYGHYVNYMLNDHTASAILVSMLMCSMVLVFSAVLYSYMHGRRSADFFHSMPVERSTMLTANFAAGMTALTVPVWVNSLIAMLSYPILMPNSDWIGLWKIMLLELVAWTIGAFVLFAISTLVAVTVSTAVENVGYTVAVLLEGSIMLVIWDVACSIAFESYVSMFDGGDIVAVLGDVLYYLSPVFALAKVIIFLLDGSTQASFLLFAVKAWLPLLFWLLLGAGALWFAVKQYSKRQSERAEQWGRQSWLGFSVKLMSAVGGAFLFAVTFGEVLGLDSRYMFVFGALVGSPLVYLVIEAITNRGFHSMKKCLPYLALSTAIILVGSLYFAFDGFGFDKKVPNPSDVKSVKVELDSLLSTRIYNDEYAMKYEVVNGKDNSNYFYSDYYMPLYEVEEPETIELITKIHQTATEETGNYWGYIQLSYRGGLSQMNRTVQLRSVNTENVLQLLYCDEMLEKYNPFFEMEADYLEFVQVTDKMGNLIGEGEISEEHWAALLEAIRSDLKNCEAVDILDTENNLEVAQLTFATKYPKEIFQNYSALYHHDTRQVHVVRAKDEATLKVLEEMGLELKVQESFYDRLMSVNLTEAYANILPGIAQEYGSYEFDKYDYYLGEQELTDAEAMHMIVENATLVNNDRGDQYVAEIFIEEADGIHASSMRYYVDRAVIAELMAKNNNFLVPYILNHEEQALLDVIPEVQIAENAEYINLSLSSAKVEYWHWSYIQELENTVSMRAYCEQHCPQILEGKTSAELKCMEMTPYLDSNGNILDIGF